MTNKLTNRKALAIAIAVMKENGAEPGLNTLLFEEQGYDAADVIAKLESMAASLDNRTSDRKPNATQIENAKLRESIMAYLYEAPALVVTCSDIGRMVPALAGLNNQKISPLMKALEKEGRVQKIVDKRKTFYKLAGTDLPEKTEDKVEDGE